MKNQVLQKTLYGVWDLLYNVLVGEGRKVVIVMVIGLELTIAKTGWQVERKHIIYNIFSTYKYINFLKGIEVVKEKSGIYIPVFITQIYQAAFSGHYNIYVFNKWLLQF